MALLLGLRNTDYRSTDQDTLVESINKARPFVRPTPYSDTSLSCDRWFISVNDSSVTVTDKLRLKSIFGALWNLDCSTSLDKHKDLDTALDYCKANVS